MLMLLLVPFPLCSPILGTATLRAPRSIIHRPGFLYVPPSGVSWLGLWPGATPPPTKRASVPAVLLKAVGALPDTDGEVMSPESRRSLGHRSNGLRVHPRHIRDDRDDRRGPYAMLVE